MREGLGTALITIDNMGSNRTLDVMFERNSSITDPFQVFAETCQHLANDCE